MRGQAEVNSVDAMEQACQYYKDWWEQVKGMQKEEGCIIFPLENTGLAWK
jgi:hypothetical protein